MTSQTAQSWELAGAPFGRGTVAADRPAQRYEDPPSRAGAAAPGGQLIACAGARGGAGASVLSAALAREAVRAGLSCLLVDGDPLGAGLDLLLGAEDAPGMRWPDLALARGDLVPGTLQQGLPVIDGIRVLAWDRGAAPVAALDQTLPAVLRAGRAEHDLVVLDLSRRPMGLDGDLVDIGLIVVPAEVRAASAAVKVAAQVFAGVRDVRVVVRGPAPTGLTPEAIESVLGLPIAAVLRPEPGIAAALDRGEPPGLRARGSLARACREIVAALRIRPGAQGPAW